MTYGEVPSDNGGVDKGSGFSLLISKSLRANDIGVVVTGAPYTNRNDGLVTNNGIVSSLKVPMKVDEVSGTPSHVYFTTLFLQIGQLYMYILLTLFSGAFCLCTSRWTT